MIARAKGFAGLLLACSATFACDDCDEGNEGCACYGNQTCDGSLACRSDTCVNLGEDDTSDQNEGGAPMSAGGDAPAPDVDQSPGGSSPNAGGSSPNAGGSQGADPPGPTLNEGTNWLVLQGDVAAGSEPLNGELGIEGVFYAYDDGCASYEWDMATRCIRGTHCTPSADNWGVGVGFDFYNDGVEKTVWSATQHAARGIAWTATGSDFQVWLTNMDPSLGSSCGAMLDCTMKGPPDGTPSGEYEGTLNFDDLVKDDWGGTGVEYTFDPTRLLSVQFKLPSSAVNPGFELCIDRFGIIR